MDETVILEEEEWRNRVEGVDVEGEISALTQRAFAEVPYSDHNEHIIIEKLRRDGCLALSLVALIRSSPEESQNSTQSSQTIVGHVAISPISTSSGDEHWYGLGPVSVSPAHQRRGIGSKLVRAALQKIAEKKTQANGCVVLGDPSFYQRFGFKAAETTTSMLNAPTPSQLHLKGIESQEHFMSLAFAPNVNGKPASGEVFYHRAFFE